MITNNKYDCMDAGGTTPRMGEVERRRERAPKVGALGDAGVVADGRLAGTVIVQTSIKMVRYRLDVGSKHQVTLEELKKILIEESGVDKNNINNINIQGDYTLVELPDEMPQDIFLHLKSVEIKQHKLDIKRVKARNKRRSNNYGRRGRQRTPPSSNGGSDQARGV
ncbi:MAG: DbpA RNA binding domain-containing protein [Methylobacter sp.]|nr:DbpA RNA binding domain-containing protein [Methylobacter sp.]